ncbi:MAG: aspartate dehydrogenase [Lachnospiraceae bacterium]|nr:aspartate dehydrogenase [Lachnospiraceae bacterium]
MMFGKKQMPTKTYDKEIKKPAIRCSICTGERVAGFINRNTGKFEEIWLLQSEKDLDGFLKTYGIKKEEMSEIY